ncbi:MAG TPA: amidohydrolase family protein [Bacteroidales bacterium]|nr:amidohydrolase family protein [Bacteroidales bacterium]HPT11888.1 amidohydrolase family protein [Bacteroidales bacterium]
MRKISAQYIFTGEGNPLKKAIINATDDGVITDVEYSGGDLEERASTEFYNGIIVPGFINCHCHLELSHMLSLIEKGTGLGGFIRGINTMRKAEANEIVAAAVKADRQMYDEGIVACGDISNSSVTFDVKKNSQIEYVTFIEVFGADPSKASKRIAEAEAVKNAAEVAGLPHYVVPHSVYSVSQELFSKLLEYQSTLVSMHFLESPDERLAVSRRCGPMVDSYIALGIDPASMDPPPSHLDVALMLAQKSSRLILVHNTCITQQESEMIAENGNISWCLCPSSNKYITGGTPPAEMLSKTKGQMVIGTDSLSSNNSLSILKELKLLQDDNPILPLETLIRWATANGAGALGLSDSLGTIRKGKKPGLLLIENIDLQNMKLLPQSKVRRLL